MSTHEPDYLAVVNIEMSSGSYARSDDAEEAIEMALHQAYMDFRSVFDLEGKPVEVQTFDARGHDRLIVSTQGVEDADTRATLNCEAVFTRYFPRTDRATAPEG